MSFVARPRTSLACLQSTVTALPNAECKTEVLHSLLSIPTHKWAVAKNDESSNEAPLLEYSTSHQLRCYNETIMSFALCQCPLYLKMPLALYPSLNAPKQIRTLLVRTNNFRTNSMMPSEKLAGKMRGTKKLDSDQKKFFIFEVPNFFEISIKSNQNNSCSAQW